MIYVKNKTKVLAISIFYLKTLFFTNYYIKEVTYELRLIIF